MILKIEMHCRLKKIKFSAIKVSFTDWKNYHIYDIKVLLLLLLVTVVEGDPKIPFSIATTPRYRGRRYSFPWIAPLNPWSLPYNAEC